MPVALGSYPISKVYLGSNEIDASYLGLTKTFPAEGTRLLFSGATSVLGGTEYQMGQLWHTVTIANGLSTVSVIKTNQTTDVDISSFQNTGTVTTNNSTTFQIRALGNRNGAASTLRGAGTEDGIGINGFNPGKIDSVGGNDTEQIKWEVRDLSSAFTLSIKKIYCTRANYDGTVKPMCVVTPFDPLGLTAGYPIATSDDTVFPINVAPNLDLVGTGTGANGDFITGVDSTDVGDVGYSLYAIDFDVTTTPVQLFSNAVGDIYVNAAGDSYTQP